jgi:hypothetical protein
MTHQQLDDTLDYIRAAIRIIELPQVRSHAEELAIVETQMREIAMRAINILVMIEMKK